MPPVSGMFEQDRDDASAARWYRSGAAAAKRTFSRKRWFVARPHERSEALARSLGVHPLVAQVLLNRGIDQVEAGRTFLRPKLTELIDPRQMPGVDAAVDRLRSAIESGRRITIYGDYDVDGITGVAILLSLLRLLGAQVDYYIPHRLEEGYGLNREAVASLARAGTELLVTVDCGITAFDSAKLADELGIELIITDHHRPESVRPTASVTVHPALRPDYPNLDSAGAMVAFKLAWALADTFNGGRRLEGELRQLMLDATSLAAIGTVADVVPLVGENRVLTHYGLAALPHCRLPGIQALIESAGLTGRGLDSYHIGFRLAPMLNAAGRMGHARLAVELLSTDSPIRAAQIAEYLKHQNAKRRQCERRILKQACEMVVSSGQHHPDRKSIILASDNWHSGVIGIVAARLVDKYLRPTIMLNMGPDGLAQGSGRSVPGFCLLSAIRACSEHLVSFGGHAMAAGLTIPNDRVSEFAEAFEAYTAEHLQPDELQGQIEIDAEATLGQFDRRLVSELARLAPFGQGNPEPVFLTRAVRLAGPPRRVGSQADHLQLVVTDRTATMRCIGFGFGKLEKRLLELECFDIAYQPQINDYNGNNAVELVLVDVGFE